jgi:exopolysaccharide biosynthesis polyprenyl glycosylphosphotransferase
VVLGRDVRAPEVLCAFTGSPGYLLRRYTSITTLVLIDLLGLVAASALVKWACAAHVPELASVSPLLVGVFGIVLVTIFAANHLYGLREVRRLRRRRVRAAAWFIVAAAGASLVGVLPLPVAVVAALLTVAFLTAGRELFDFGLRVLFGLDPEGKRVALVGSGETCSLYARGQIDNGIDRPRILGMIDPAAATTPAPRGGPLAVPALGRLGEIDKILDFWSPDEIVIVDPEVERLHLTDLADVCRRRRMTLKLVDLEMRFSARGVCLIPTAGEAMFVAAPSTPSGLAWMVKRCIDVTTAATLLVVLSPLFAAIALAVKLSSRGPVFYSAERVGLGQRRFRCHKFRTMRVDADLLQDDLEAFNEADGAVFKIRDDPRVTAIGRILRATSIDELPQLINVIRGDMSIVGPRPLPLRDNLLLEPWHKQRHVVLPGMTGPWQVGGRSDTPFREMIRLDLEYVDSWSLWLDLSIAWRTLRVIAGRRGAF